jgi:hypothetical protein
MALGLVVLGFLADHISQLHIIALSILLVLMAMLFVMACTQSIELSPQAQKHKNHLKSGMNVFRCSNRFFGQRWEVQLGNKTCFKLLLLGLERMGLKERSLFVLLMRELFYMSDEQAVHMHSSLANGSRCVQISFMKKLLEDHSHENWFTPGGYQEHIVAVPGLLLVWGVGLLTGAVDATIYEASPLTLAAWWYFGLGCIWWLFIWWYFGQKKGHQQHWKKEEKSSSKTIIQVLMLEAVATAKQITFGVGGYYTRITSGLVQRGKSLNASS